MNPTSQAPSPPLRHALWVLLVAVFGLHSECASAADDAAVQALQRQLQQVQATLQQLAQENRALREHQQELDRKLAELSGGPSPAMVAQGTAQPNAAALPDASAVPNGSALPSTSMSIWWNCR